jgi:hypothetical protein
MSKFEKSFEFSEILEKSMNSESEIHDHSPLLFTSDYTAGWSSDIDPMHLSYLLGSLDIETIPTVNPLKNPYLKYKKIIQRPNHILTSLQKKALELINSQLTSNDSLPENFNLQQLKRSYKKAALKSHPDCGGSHESFLALKSDYEMLLAFLRSIK